jgi:hypothetical protein
MYTSFPVTSTLRVDDGDDLVVVVVVVVVDFVDVLCCISPRVTSWL